MSTISPSRHSAQPLSVIILNHRHDQRLVAALKSSQFADEIIVVDYQSQAEWQKLQTQFKFRLVKQARALTDFAVARNQALQLASHDWVLFLDSDETVPASSVAALRTVLTHPRAAAFLVKRVDFFLGRSLDYGEAGSMHLVRLMKKAAAHFNRPVHEIAQITGPVLPTSIILHHQAHLNISQFLKDISCYAQREAEFRISQDQPIFMPSLIIWPVGKFIFNYILKLGFLDSWRGLIYALMMSLHSFLVRVFYYEKIHL